LQSLLRLPSVILIEHKLSVGALPRGIFSYEVSGLLRGIQVLPQLRVALGGVRQSIEEEPAEMLPRRKRPFCIAIFGEKVSTIEFNGSPVALKRLSPALSLHIFLLRFFDVLLEEFGIYAAGGVLAEAVMAGA